MDNILYVILGVAAGLLAGMFGIGGGIIIIPTLIYLFGYSQHQAQGTSIAILVLPIGILGAIRYYQQGYVNLKAVGLISLGFFLAALVGAKFAVSISDALLRKCFGVFLLVVAIRTIFWK